MMSLMSQLIIFSSIILCDYSVVVEIVLALHCYYAVCSRSDKHRLLVSNTHTHSHSLTHSLTHSLIAVYSHALPTVCVEMQHTINPNQNINYFSEMRFHTYKEILFILHYTHSLYVYSILTVM